MLQLRYIVSLFILIATIAADAQTLNYYFGNIHAHSSYSDGNKDSSLSGLTTPLQNFNYAKNSQQIDFYGISEHNHYSAGMTAIADYHRGLADADSATVDGTFVALYGMEWGVISGGGHVLVYGYDSLIGWDNNTYDVYVASSDYATLWKKINEKPGAFAYLAHPQSTDYSGLFSSSAGLMADNAIVGMAARSGPAFSTNTTYSNPSGSNFIARYNDALKRGYHLGVGLDHDTHNSVFGRQTAGRMVVLAPALTRADILTAIRKMRFYSSDDWNVKVSFTIANMPMGTVFSHAGVPVIKVKVTDPNSSDHTASIVIYRGVPGSNSAPTTLTTVNNADSMSYTHNISNNDSYYYYAKITQTDGNTIWTSPIWYKRNDAITEAPPVANFTLSDDSICAGQTITFSDNSGNSPTDWNWSFGNAVPPASFNQNGITTYSAPGTYNITLTASNAYGTSNTVTKSITVLPLPDVQVTSITMCQGATDTLVATGADSYIWNDGTQGSALYVSPFSTANYAVTGTAANGCSKMVQATVTVQPCTGVDEAEPSQKTIAIFPNPATQSITMDIGTYEGTKTIEIYDMLGKLVWTQTGTDTVYKIDVSAYHNGNYIVYLKIENKIQSSSLFIVER